jgi:predicted GNAT family N-acyltransferase
MRIDVMSWEQAEPVAAPIRFAIFMGEKDAAGVELDELDKDCVHAIAYDDAGKAIGTARLLPDGQIGRMAVVKEWRRRGVGAGLLEGLVNEARKRGLAEVRLSAPVQALEFYRERGFVADGKIQPVGGGLQQPLKKSLGG